MKNDMKVEGEQLKKPNISDGWGEEKWEGGDVLYGIDVKSGLSHMAGNKKLFRDMLQKLSINYAQFDDRIKTVLKADGLADAGRMIHTLKGLAGSLGMTRLRTLSDHAEEQIRHGVMSESSHVLQQLTDELTMVLNAIRIWIPSDAPRTAEQPAMVARQKLHELERTLNEHSPEAVRQMKEIGNIKGYEQELERLRRAVAAYEFDTALEVFKSMKISGEKLPPGQP